MASWCLFFSLVLISQCLALNNGVAITPPMGWNPYNAFLCSTTDVQYRSAAQSLVSLGLNTLGYNYVNLDCGWQGKTRNSTGGFTWDTTTIASGIPALSSFIHNLGLKFGVYSDGGFFACDFVGGSAKYLGSLGHETSDANSFAAWGADYLKYDNCYAVSETDFVNFNPPIEIRPHYVTMRDALSATRRPIVFSICEWGVQDPARWPASAVGNSWRISNDIGPPASWDNLFRIINQVVPVTQFAGPGAWNDLDMLEVGNSGLALAEQQTHFAFWAATKSPLIISTDLSKISTASLNILKNPRIIALNAGAFSFYGSENGLMILYSKTRLENPSVSDEVVVVINLQNTRRSLTLNLADIGFASANAVDLITGTSLGRLATTFTSTVDAHGCVVLKLSGATAVAAPSFTFYNAASSINTLSGGASTRVVNTSVTVVGFVGNGGTLTFNGVDGGTSGGTKTLSFDYINGDVTFTNTACSNCRNAFISINGGTAVQVQMPISAQSWDILFTGYLVSLPGFRAGKTNTIQISNPSAFAPDFFRLGVSI